MKTQVHNSISEIGAQTPGEHQQETRRHFWSLLEGRGLVLLGAVLLMLFGAVTALVLSLDPRTLDVPITRVVQDITWSPAADLLQAVSWPGFSPQNFIWPVVIVLGVALLLRRIVEAAFLVLATVANTACDLVKLLVHRGRPSIDFNINVIGHSDTYSFPSGHVCQYVLFFGLSFYLVFTLMKPGLLRTLLLVICGGLILLVGPSRIWMGQHWASDVLGGYTLGFGLLLLIIWGYRGWEKRRVSQKV